MKRFGQIIGLKPFQFKRYRECHSEDLPEIIITLKSFNLRDYTIFQKGDFLYAYFEYTGDDFFSDISKIASNSLTAEWWNLLKPMQQPIISCKKEELKNNMNLIFHFD